LAQGLQLRGLTAAVDPFQDDEAATGGGGVGLIHVTP
jgi:hypothetical protein